MIALDRTKETMLAEIEASDRAFTNRLGDASDAKLTTSDEASFVLQAGTREEILLKLRTVLKTWLADVPPERFTRDIGLPVKMGLGNAYKRGIHGDPDKRITAEAVLTKTGVLVVISDEGSGFDVEKTLQRFRMDESYATHNGGGFKSFERARSVISYADGGRTLLIRFLRGPEESEPELAGSEKYMKYALAGLSMFRKHRIPVESCDISKLERHRPGQPEFRYALVTRERATEPRSTILTGRLLTQSAALREYSVAKQLYKDSFKRCDGLRVPKPMAVFKRHPRLVLYRFDPNLDLYEYLNGVSDQTEVVEVLTAVGAGLRRLHESVIAVDIDEEPRNVREQHQRAEERIVQAMAEALPDQVASAQRFCRDLEEMATNAERFSERAPIHGSFGLDCVVRASDRFYLYRFDQCRVAHPGFDVGGLLADLSRLKGRTPESHLRRTASESFLHGYLAGNSPPWLEALPFFIASAKLLHLQRLVECPGKDWRAEADALL